MRRPKKFWEQGILLENAFSEIVIRFLLSWIAGDTASKNWETGRVFCWRYFAAQREKPESIRFQGVVRLPGVQGGVREICTCTKNATTILRRVRIISRRYCRN